MSKSYDLCGNVGGGGGVRDWLNAVNIEKEARGATQPVSGVAVIIVREEMRHTQYYGSPCSTCNVRPSIVSHRLLAPIFCRRLLPTIISHRLPPTVFFPPSPPSMDTQRDLCKLRLNTARSYVKMISDGQGPVSFSSGVSLRLNARVQGIGPRFQIKIDLQNTGSKVRIILRYMEMGGCCCCCCSGRRDLSHPQITVI